MIQLHTDWPWPFRLIPRSLTRFPSKHLPQKLLGSAPASEHLDVTPCGTWALCWPPYLTVRSSKGWHFRIGARYDYNALAYMFPSFTIKKVRCP